MVMGNAMCGDANFAKTCATVNKGPITCKYYNRHLCTLAACNDIQPVTQSRWVYSNLYPCHNSAITVRQDT